jgi:hypothetical protein
MPRGHCDRQSINELHVHHFIPDMCMMNLACKFLSLDQNDHENISPKIDIQTTGLPTVVRVYNRVITYE